MCSMSPRASPAPSPPPGGNHDDSSSSNSSDDDARKRKKKRKKKKGPYKVKNAEMRLPQCVPERVDVSVLA